MSKNWSDNVNSIPNQVGLSLEVLINRSTIPNFQLMNVLIGKDFDGCYGLYNCNTKIDTTQIKAWTHT